MNSATCDPAAVQRVADALSQNSNNFGIGIINKATNEIHLIPYDDTDSFSDTHPHLQVMAGHEAAAAMAGVPEDQARGFVLARQNDQWHVVNSSHLNAPEGQPNSMRMDPQLFAMIIDALAVAGVISPHIR